jgi:CelD/BcsL family acetyltransferase involved in cellulose biosynthesis
MSIADSPAMHATAHARTRPAETLVEPIEDGSALRRVLGDWTRLWSLCPDASAFLAPQWLLPWWRHLGRGALAAAAVRSTGDGELVAFAAMYVYRHPQTGQHHLFPIGIGTTDHLDVLVRPGWEDAALRAILAHFDERHDWDLLEFPQLRSDSPLLRTALPRGWRRELVDGESSPLVRFDGASALPLPKAMAQNVRTARHRAERAGGVAYELVDARSLPAALDALQALHASRWSERGESGVLADPAVQAFHREAAPALLDAGLLRLHVLRLDGAIAAVLYALADPPSSRDPRHAYYLGGFDPRHRALSPGSLLVAHAMEQALAEGAAGFDFLRGAEPYKYRWGAVDQPMFTLRAWRRPGVI